MLQSELDQASARHRSRPYRPETGLDPEYEGLPLDPDPVAGAPFLFTLAGLAEQEAREVPSLPPLSDVAKQALRREVQLADEYANLVGREICTLLLRHRLRVQEAITEYIEPQIESLLEQLSLSLDMPFGDGLLES